MPLRAFKSYTLPSQVQKNDQFVQVFLSDPQKLLLGDKAPDISRIYHSLSKRGVRMVLVHSSYLVSDAVKGYQKALLKQEISGSLVLSESGVSVPAYIVHLHSKSVEEAVRHIDTRGIVAYENTSRVVQPKAYTKLLYGKRVVIDTAHLFSSGMAKSPQQALEVIKHLKTRASVIAIHLNDQKGDPGSGRDIHAAIGKGCIFDHSPEALELFWYIVRNFDVVLEYAESMDEHAFKIQQFVPGVSVSSTGLYRASILARRLSARCENGFQRQVYDQYARALEEISSKEEGLVTGEKSWSLYGLNDKVASLILYSSVCNPEDLDHEATLMRDQRGMPRKQALQILKRLMVLMGPFASNTHSAGSIRREKGFIGDIDLVFCSADGADGSALLSRLRNRGVTARAEGDVLFRFDFEGLQVDLYTCSPTQLGCMLLYLTGSKYFNIRMRRTAKALGYKLANRELIKTTPRGSYCVKTTSEEHIFKILGLEYVPPRFRVM